MRRREFITLLGGAAAAWPLAARAQQTGIMRRIGVLMNLAADDPEGQARIAAFHQGLQEWGWTLGRNARIDVRWGAFDADSSRRYAAEVVGLAPDVILASASAAMGALQQTNRTVPIVFVGIVDPVGAGFVESLARPGGNTTGFTPFEYTLSGRVPDGFKTARVPLNLCTDRVSGACAHSCIGVARSWSFSNVSCQIGAIAADARA
jgi:putative tryptophan/tyrosine transport system substrate-binding protein